MARIVGPGEAVVERRVVPVRSRGSSVVALAILAAFVATCVLVSAGTNWGCVIHRHSKKPRKILPPCRPRRRPSSTSSRRRENEGGPTSYTGCNASTRSTRSTAAPGCSIMSSIPGRSVPSRRRVRRRRNFSGDDAVFLPRTLWRQRCRDT